MTGGFTFQSPPFWQIQDPQMQGWIQISAREVGPDGEATGMWRVQLYKEAFGGWRRLDGEVVKLDFGELNGNPAVALLVKITRAEGWGTQGPDADPKIGEYGWSLLCDGGAHGPESSDFFALKYYSMAPLDEYFPTMPPDFGLWNPGMFVIPVMGGNVTIHGE